MTVVFKSAAQMLAAEGAAPEGGAAAAEAPAEEPVEEGLAAWEKEMRPAAAKAKPKPKGRTKDRVLAEIVEELE